MSYVAWFILYCANYDDILCAVWCFKNYRHAQGNNLYCVLSVRLMWHGIYFDVRIKLYKSYIAFFPMIASINGWYDFLLRCCIFSFHNRESWKSADLLYVLRQGLTHAVSQSRNWVWCTTIRMKNFCCCAGYWITNTMHFRLKHLVKLFLKAVFWNRNL